MRRTTVFALILFVIPFSAFAEMKLSDKEYAEMLRLHQRISRYAPKGLVVPKAQPLAEPVTDPNRVNIGITLDYLKGRFIVTNVAPLSAAEKAGILVGDEIKEIDGKLIYQTMDIPTVQLKLNGKPDSIVKLKIGRTSGGYSTVAVTRFDAGLAPDFEISLKDGAINVRVVRFGSSFKTLFPTAIGEYVHASSGGIVFDLRNSQGGSIDAVGGLVGAFVKPGSIFAQVGDGSGNRKLTTSALPTIPADRRAVFLVNAQTAVPGELAALALRERGRITIVGTKTTGLGLLTFEDGTVYSSIRMQLTSEKNELLTKSGIAPTYPVKDKPRVDIPFQTALKIFASHDGKLDQWGN